MNLKSARWKESDVFAIENGHHGKVLCCLPEFEEINLPSLTVPRINACLQREKPLRMGSLHVLKNRQPSMFVSRLEAVSKLPPVSACVRNCAQMIKWILVIKCDYAVMISSTTRVSPEKGEINQSEVRPCWSHPAETHENLNVTHVPPGALLAGSPRTPHLPFKVRNQPCHQGPLCARFAKDSLHQRPKGVPRLRHSMYPNPDMMRQNHQHCIAHCTLRDRYTYDSVGHQPSLSGLHRSRRAKKKVMERPKVNN